MKKWIQNHVVGYILLSVSLVINLALLNYSADLYTENKDLKELNRVLLESNELKQTIILTTLDSIQYKADSIFQKIKNENDSLKMRN